jgi:hypothetical protein
MPLRTGLVLAGELPTTLYVYIIVYVGVNGRIYNHVNEIYKHLNGHIYMTFREAIDALCTCLNHQDVAKALGVSVQTVRQARLKEDSDGFRAPPRNWERAVIRLAEARVSHYHKLLEKLTKPD